MILKFEEIEEIECARKKETERERESERRAIFTSIRMN